MRTLDLITVRKYKTTEELSTFIRLRINLVLFINFLSINLILINLILLNAIYHSLAPKKGSKRSSERKKNAGKVVYTCFFIDYGYLYAFIFFREII